MQTVTVCTFQIIHPNSWKTYVGGLCNVDYAGGLRSRNGVIIITIPSINSR